MRPVLVGIAGGSASGKSTLAAALKETLGQRALLVLHDRYYHSLPAHLRHDPVAHNFDHPDALETSRMIRDLADLRSGHPASLPHYDYATHSRREEEEEVAPCPFILVEGILVLADERLRDMLDLRVYVNTPADVRLIRRIRRDVETRGREVDEILARYESTVRPMHQRYVEPSRTWADLVLDGTAPLDHSVAMVLERVGAQ